MKLEKRAKLILNKLGIVDYTTGMNLFNKENRSLLETKAFEGFSLTSYLNNDYFEYDSSGPLLPLLETTYEMSEQEMFEYLLEYSGILVNENTFVAPGRFYQEWSPAHENGMTVTFNFEKNEITFLPVSEDYEETTVPLAPVVSSIVSSVKSRILHDLIGSDESLIDRAVISPFAYYAGLFL